MLKLNYKIDYKTILEQAFVEYGAMVLQRQELDLELAKKTQFIRATMNMLPDSDKAVFETALSNLGGPSLGLTDAIRKALQTEPNKPFTASHVRDKLKLSNFDFNSYKTNPLASIHAVLKRLKPEEVETTDIDGVTAWRWVGEPLPSLGEWFAKFADPTVTSTLNAFYAGHHAPNALSKILAGRTDLKGKK
jgi:hypothetical protein